MYTGFKGNARVILPGLSPCVDCTLDLYPPQVNYPLCTIASKPRLPEHCVEYVNILLWTKEKPFEYGVSLDGDNPDHMQWVFEKAQGRAREYGIQGVTYRLAKGVVKRIIPAVASTNAVIAAVCATEVFKLATSCSKPLQNFMVFNDTDGVYTYTFEAERKEDCISCSTKPISLTFTTDTTLQQLYDYLKENQKFLMKAPSITTVIDGKNKTLYMPTLDAVERATRPNLQQKLTDLGVLDGHHIVVADATTPKPVAIIVKFEQEMEPCAT
ncbi:NEDD8-activating enzyme E1 catalytic subunit [Geodia barretti]|uniref:NEDD8-activating enzyme E1 catalytic subunit n=3 Tax=Geodia barretti TaxID=519541 RepID=A0AA35RPR1_GEOBA|nr:NEDD8-activating enzyme E1 catalytic subunit [Geodia barretti]